MFMPHINTDEHANKKPCYEFLKNISSASHDKLSRDRSTANKNEKCMVMPCRRLVQTESFITPSTSLEVNNVYMRKNKKN